MKFWKTLKNIYPLSFSPVGLLARLINGVGRGLSNLFERVGGEGFLDSVASGVGNLFKGTTGSGLTNAEIQQNDWNAEQAQINRDYQTEMDNTKYQRAVADMNAAGLNPAMMFGSNASVSSAPSGSMASGGDAGTPSAGFLDSILNLIFAKERLNNLKADVNLKDSQARANIWNAWANFKNAGSQERQAGAAERQAGAAERNAAVNEFRAGIEKMLADKDVEVKDKSIEKMAEELAYTHTMREFVSKNYEILKQNANSLQRQSIAAMRQADAAIQNAATNSELASYNTDLMYSQVLLNEVLKGQHLEILHRLPDKLRFEVENLQKQGVLLDEQGRLVHRNGNLATANTIRSYVSCATDVARTVASFIPGTNSGSAFGGLSSFDMPSYMGIGTYYE